MHTMTSGPVPDEEDFEADEVEDWIEGPDGTCLDPPLLREGRELELEWLRKHDVFEIARRKSVSKNRASHTI